MPDGAKSSPLKRALVYALLTAVSFIMLYPLLWMVSSSFKPENEIFATTSLIPQEFTLDAYRRGWNGLSVSFGHLFLNSLLISVLVVIGNLISCSMAAYAFTRLQFKGRGFWFALMLGTLMMPQHAVLIPQYLMFLKFGWVNTIMPLVVPKFFAIDAFFIFLMVQFFRGIPRELDEAAIMDGAGPLRIFLKVILPLSTPVLATAAVFSFIWTWDDFFAPLIYLNDIEKYTAQLGLRTFVDATAQSDWGALLAMSTLTVLPIFILFLLFQRLLIEGIATTGMKR
ncbi:MULTISPECIES: carbohydrate ABC transporter permease [Ensifer]|uniref:ABC transporter permease subunit n=1 Tax=Ensifer canadensis TaxID=555315 RepID=A0AAW4FLF4_9HYPH|nr:MULTISPECIES: carbohydrate ABC transporter permease [Ensifer]KQU90858.1 sugar ABC transporter permease [Ensifer sp. Root31]KQW50627.1 sugar ABC transporter permease [Ensifer sp. Root1252]KQW67708.1 sugar ABC transporter permease [Ensifer sp. Root127]KQY63419.1 sugar ABC transporter permease [Ensifer sp. Root142]KRC74850.1 sugar ABC transporter permease [Ensifer sp. Root231]